MLHTARSRMALTWGLLLALVCAASPSHAQLPRVRGQTLYVPVTSEVPFGDRERTLNLTATLSIRNTDRQHPIRVTRIDYHNSDGTLLHSYLEAPLTLAPLSSRHVVVKESDRSGGISASFILVWQAGSAVSAPLVESLMIGTVSGQGVSFTGAARVLEEQR